MDNERKEKLEVYKDNNKYPYSETTFPKEKSIQTIRDEYKENKEVSVAGRLITRRKHGKSVFFDIKDYSGKIQGYIRKDLIGEGEFQWFKMVDIGDILGIKGKLVKTRTGEITVLASEFKLLSKALRPLPEKWHGLKDKEIKFRKRYLDLIMNPETVSVFRNKNKIIKAIKNSLDNQDFLEVETPMLHTIPGGAAGCPFKTHHNALDIDIYLRIAPELYLKKLLVGNFDNIYELNRSFRNEGVSVKHNPEFSMLEVYSTYKDYSYMMDLTENLIRETIKNVFNTTSLEYQGKKIDFSKSFKKFSLANQLKEDFGVEFDDSPEDFLKKMAFKLDIKKEMSRSQLINLIEDLIEGKYYGNEPVFVTDFYTWMSPLAKTKKGNPNIVERFELFIGGIEIANAYSELNDPIAQKQRLQAKLNTDEELPKKIDEDFLEALEYGMPPAAGLGIGIDRLVMILLNKASLKEVIFFPLLKPQDA